MRTITMQDWTNAKTFTSLIEEVKEKFSTDYFPVTEDIVEHFLGSVPPIESGKTRHDFINLPLCINWYFLAGERVNSQGYFTFVRTGHGDNLHYFYVGLWNKNISN